MNETVAVRMVSPLPMAEATARLASRLTPPKTFGRSEIRGGCRGGTVAAGRSEFGEDHSRYPHFNGTIADRAGETVLEGVIGLDVRPIRTELIYSAIPLAVILTVFLILCVAPILFDIAFIGYGVLVLPALAFAIGYHFHARDMALPEKLAAESDALVTYLQESIEATSVEQGPVAGSASIPRRVLFGALNRQLGLEALRLPPERMLVFIRPLALLGILAGVGFFIFYAMFTFIMDRGLVTFGSLIPPAVRAAVPLAHIVFCGLSLHAVGRLVKSDSAIRRRVAQADFDVTAIFAMACGWCALLVIGKILIGLALFY